MSMDVPHKRNRANAIALLRSIRNVGFEPGYVVADRAYGPGSQAKDFTRPAKALGYKPVMDRRADQLGMRSSQGGANFMKATGVPPRLVPGPR